MSGLAINGDVVHGLAMGGTPFIPKSSVKESLIGKKVSGIKSVMSSYTDNYYNGEYKYDGDDYSWDTCDANVNDSDTGIISGETNINGKIYVSINNENGKPMLFGYGLLGDSPTWHIVWFDLSQLTIVGGGN